MNYLVHIKELQLTQLTRLASAPTNTFESEDDNNNKNDKRVNGRKEWNEKKKKNSSSAKAPTIAKFVSKLIRICIHINTMRKNIRTYPTLLRV